MPAVVRIENLRVDYRSREIGQKVKTAVENLTLSVNEGEVFGFLGPNGAGKTTTFYLITGLIRPDAGQVSLDGAVSTFCSPRDSFAWSIGDRVFVFAAGKELRLRDGRVLAPDQGDNFVIHEIVDANIDNPVHDEPDFCPLTLIALAFQRYAPDEAFGWGGDACISDEILGLGTIAGVDQAGYSEVMGGGGGSDRFVGFVARLDGIWTVLELVPYETFADCDDLSVVMAREICARSPISWNTAATS